MSDEHNMGCEEDEVFWGPVTDYELNIAKKFANRPTLTSSDLSHGNSEENSLLIRTESDGLSQNEVCEQKSQLEDKSKSCRISTCESNIESIDVQKTLFSCSTDDDKEACVNKSQATDRHLENSINVEDANVIQSDSSNDNSGTIATDKSLTLNENRNDDYGEFSQLENRSNNGENINIQNEIENIVFQNTLSPDNENEKCKESSQTLESLLDNSTNKEDPDIFPDEFSQSLNDYNQMNGESSQSLDNKFINSINFELEAVLHRRKFSSSDVSKSSRRDNFSCSSYKTALEDLSEMNDDESYTSHNYVTLRNNCKSRRDTYNVEDLSDSLDDLDFNLASSGDSELFLSSSPSSVSCDRDYINQLSGTLDCVKLNCSDENEEENTNDKENQKSTIFVTASLPEYRNSLTCMNAKSEVSSDLLSPVIIPSLKYRYKSKNEVTFKTPKLTVPKKSTKDRFENIVSPVAKYIKDAPVPLIKNFWPDEKFCSNRLVKSAPKIKKGLIQLSPRDKVHRRLFPTPVIIRHK